MSIDIDQRNQVPRRRLLAHVGDFRNPFFKWTTGSYEKNSMGLKFRAVGATIE